jgi:predicted flap endonuclease-1-like 5' DNA nuclease
VMDTNYLLIILIVLVVAAALLFVWMRRDRAETPAETETLPVADADLVAVTAAAPAQEDGPPDNLTMLKGLGPKAAGQLNALGITRFGQLAALSNAELDRIDAQMGNFRGRIVRDRWVEQAEHLAAGDVAGFEAKFGKLGG